MDVYDIVKKHLEDNGFDGLFNANGECACNLKCLMPCDESISGCEPGYEQPCATGEHDFHICISKDSKHNLKCGEEDE